MSTLFSHLEPRGAAACLLALALAPAAPVRAGEGRADVSLQVVAAGLTQLEETDVGLGARFSWRLTRWLAADAGLSLFPADLGEPALSASRLEGLVGVRIGPRLGRAGAYAVLKGGAVRFSAAPAPFPCIMIYPPPLRCALAGGKTLPALGLGLGLEVFPRERLVLRLEAGDEMLRYPGPVLGEDREAFEGDFWSHGLRVSLSVGFRP